MLSSIYYQKWYGEEKDNLSYNLNTGLVLVFFSYGLLLFSGNFCSFFSFIIFALIFDNILYMRNINVNVLSKRYFTKKTIKNQFFGKRGSDKKYYHFEFEIDFSQIRDYK
jgi:hypothetical protein